MLPRRIPVLSRPPVVLRAFRDSDAALVQSAATDPLIPLITSVPVTGSRADALAFIGRQHQRLSAGQGCSFAITEAASGAPVGQAGLWLRDADLGRASIGYWIAAPHRRRGYTTAALDAISRWGLTLDGIDRLELYVEPWNEGSWRAAERAGYHREGLLRRWQYVGQERRDMYMYSLLPEDLPAGEDPAGKAVKPG
jgi:RimJ/RimL family protein N-acetyltransferase